MVPLLQLETSRQLHGTGSPPLASRWGRNIAFVAVAGGEPSHYATSPVVSQLRLTVYWRTLGATRPSVRRHCDPFPPRPAACRSEAEPSSKEDSTRRLPKGLDQDTSPVKRFPSANRLATDPNPLDSPPDLLLTFPDRTFIVANGPFSEPVHRFPRHRRSLIRWNDPAILSACRFCRRCGAFPTMSLRIRTTSRHTTFRDRTASTFGRRIPT